MATITNNDLQIFANKRIAECQEEQARANNVIKDAPNESAKKSAETAYRKAATAEKHCQALVANLSMVADFMRLRRVGTDELSDIFANSYSILKLITLAHVLKRKHIATKDGMLDSENKYDSGICEALIALAMYDFNTNEATAKTDKQLARQMIAFNDRSKRHGPTQIGQFSVMLTRLGIATRYTAKQAGTDSPVTVLHDSGIVKTLREIYSDCIGKRDRLDIAANLPALKSEY